MTTSIEDRPAALVALRDGRRRVVEQHRADWNLMRGLAQDTIRAAERLAPGPERERALRQARSALRSALAGERRAWGLNDARGKRSAGEP